VTDAPQRYVAVIGPGEDAAAADVDAAREAGMLAADRGWIVLTGGRNAGVMAAAAEGARARGGAAIGILSGSDRSDAASALTAAIASGLGESRNAVLATAADAVIVCGMNAGTMSELALAARARKPAVLVNPHPSAAALLELLGNAPIAVVVSPAAAVEWLAQELAALGAG
jgi:uncharacterized protein (TIGR00725 family)